MIVMSVLVLLLTDTHHGGADGAGNKRLTVVHMFRLSRWRRDGAPVQTSLRLHRTMEPRCRPDRTRGSRRGSAPWIPVLTKNNPPLRRPLDLLDRWPRLPHLSGTSAAAFRTSVAAQRHAIRVRLRLPGCGSAAAPTRVPCPP